MDELVVGVARLDVGAEVVAGLDVAAAVEVAETRFLDETGVEIVNLLQVRVLLMIHQSGAHHVRLWATIDSGWAVG